MASVFNSRVQIHPSFVEPELILTTAQPSGFIADLGGSALRVKLGPVDKFVYMNRIDVRTQVAAQQASHNLLPSATITADYAQTAAYLIRNRAEYSELDVAEAGEWNVALPEAYRLASRQGMFQYIRTANLYGVNAGNNEGLLNAPNATTVALPADSFGNTTLSTYDNGQLALWFLGQIQALLQTMYLLGTPARLVLVGPQRVIGQMQMQNVVQLTTFQRAGAGTATTAQMLKKILEECGYELEFAYDDTLIGQGGSASTDALLLVTPEAIVPSHPGINTNVFAELSPTMKAMTLQYADVQAPVEITTPIPEGLDVVTMMRITPGWAPRGQCIRILQIPF